MRHADDRSRDGRDARVQANVSMLRPSTTEAGAKQNEDGSGAIREQVVESVESILEQGVPVEHNGQLLAADALFAYRLLLRRNPDLDLELRPLMASTLTFGAFLDVLLASPEFASTAGLLPASHLLMTEVEGFRFWWNSSDREMGVRMGLGLYEPATVDLVKRLTQPGMRCLDIGAQTGFFTCLMASRVARGGSVYAFEPMPASFDLLQRNVRENRLGRRVQALPYACSDRAATLQVSMVSNMYVVGARVDGQASVSVESVRIEDVVDDRIDLIKIDIEGHEPAALAGMTELLKRSRPIIISEANEYWLRTCSGSSAKEYVELLGSLGFTVYRVEDLETPVDSRTLQVGPLDAINVVAVPPGVEPARLQARARRPARRSRSVATKQGQGPAARRRGKDTANGKG
jgi:FkbM family methyltransferase